MSLWAYTKDGKQISGHFGELMMPNEGLIATSNPHSFSFRTGWHGPVRDRGIYVHRSARLELTADVKPESSKTNPYTIQLTCDKLADGQELYRKVVTGRIDVSKTYEEPTVFAVLDLVMSVLRKSAQ